MQSTTTEKVPPLDPKLVPLQPFVVAGKGNQTSLLSNFEWNPISAGDRPLPEADDVTPWFRNRGGDADVSAAGRPLTRRMTESMTDETFQDQYKRAFEGNVPQIFIPMRFRLPDLPFKKVQQRQVELDEGLSLYLPTTLLDDEFKTQLEEEIIRLMPHYADFERYFEVSDGRNAPPLVDEEKWIIQKRYSRLCTRYKARRQLLGHYLRRTWKATMANSPIKPSNTVSELAAFRRSRPDWRSYVLFVRTFAQRYDFLPNLLGGQLKAVPPNATKNNLTSMANELIKARKDEGVSDREWAKPLLTQYKTLRMKKRIAKRKAELAEMEAGDASQEKPKSPAKKAEEPVRAKSFAPKTFRQKLKEGRKILSERKEAAAKGNKATARANPKNKGQPNLEDTVQCSVDSQREERKEARRKRREARQAYQQRLASPPEPANPFSVPIQGIGQLFLWDSNATAVETQMNQDLTAASPRTNGENKTDDPRDKTAEKLTSHLSSDNDEPFQRSPRFSALDENDSEEDEWTEDELWQEDPEDNLTSDAGDDFDEFPPVKFSQRSNQKGRNGTTSTSPNEPNATIGILPDSASATFGTIEQIFGYERWRKAKASSEKAPPKREAIWRKRTKTRETKNFHRMLSRTSDRDPTYRALRREGLRTPEGVQRSGTEDDDEEEFTETQQDPAANTAELTTDSARKKSLSTDKNVAGRVGTTSSAPYSMRERTGAPLLESGTAVRLPGANQEGSVFDNEPIVSLRVPKVRMVQPDTESAALKERHYAGTKEERPSRRHQDVTANQPTGTQLRVGEPSGVAHHRTLEAESVIAEVQSSMHSSVVPSFTSLVSSAPSSRAASPQLFMGSGTSANPKVQPMSATSFQEPTSSARLCHRCHKPRKSTTLSVDKERKASRGWRSFKQPVQLDRPSAPLVLPSAPLPSRNPNETETDELVQPLEYSESTKGNDELNKTKSLRPSVLDTVKKLDKAILTSGRYHRHHSDKSHSPATNGIQLVAVMNTKEEHKVMECYCGPSDKTGLTAYLDVDEDHVERKRHLENIHPRYYHSHSKHVQKPDSPPKAEKTSIKVRDLLKEPRSSGQNKIRGLAANMTAKRKIHVTKSNTNVTTHQKEQHETTGERLGGAPDARLNYVGDLHGSNRDGDSQKLPRFMRKWKQLRDFARSS